MKPITGRIYFQPNNWRSALFTGGEIRVIGVTKTRVVVRPIHLGKDLRPRAISMTTWATCLTLDRAAERKAESLRTIADACETASYDDGHFAGPERDCLRAAAKVFEARAERALQKEIPF